MSYNFDDPSNWPVVISLHGIRTTGGWQKELTDELILQKIRYEPLDFDFFSALSLLFPWSRKNKVEWFHHKYSDFTDRNSQIPSLIAHSFGSYIAAEAMLKYSDIKFDKIIFCGSIVRDDYPWTDIILKRGQVNLVLNEAGGQDIWSKIVGWVVEDAGPSGVNGFSDRACDKVLQQIHTSHRHSDYFYPQNYRTNWIPFLKGSNPRQIIVPRKLQKNWRFYSFMGIILVGIFYFIVNLIITEPKVEPVTEPKVETVTEPKVETVTKPTNPTTTSPTAADVTPTEEAQQSHSKLVEILLGNWEGKYVDVESMHSCKKITTNTVSISFTDRKIDSMKIKGGFSLTSVTELQNISPNTNSSSEAGLGCTNNLNSKTLNVTGDFFFDVDESGLISASTNVTECLFDEKDCDSELFGHHNFDEFVDIIDNRKLRIHKFILKRTE